MATVVEDKVCVRPYAPLHLPNDPAERQAELERYTATTIDLLADELSRGFSDNFVKLLRYCARFHRYSARNCLPIFLQRPESSRVASYKKWREVGR